MWQYSFGHLSFSRGKMSFLASYIRLVNARYCPRFLLSLTHFPSCRPSVHSRHPYLISGRLSISGALSYLRRPSQLWSLAVILDAFYLCAGTRSYHVVTTLLLLVFRLYQAHLRPNQPNFESNNFPLYTI